MMVVVALQSFSRICRTFKVASHCFIPFHDAESLIGLDSESSVIWILLSTILLWSELKMILINLLKFNLIALQKLLKALWCSQQWFCIFANLQRNDDSYCTPMLLRDLPHIQSAFNLLSLTMSATSTCNAHYLIHEVETLLWCSNSNLRLVWQFCLRF